MATCKQCHQEFEITDQDRAFYAKMKVPEPQMCYPHRRQHLLAWRNQRTLYARTCDATQKPIISIFAPGSEYTVYDRDYWWSDAWDPGDYGVEIDFTKTFAEQYDALLKRVPMAGIFNPKTENSQYCNHVGVAKDCYLVFGSWEVENSLYSDMLISSKDSVDVLECTKVEHGYQLVGCENCYNTKYLINSERCNDSWFLYDCKNCTNCIGSTNLKNKEYYIFNQPYSKEEYEKKVKEMRLDTRSGIAAVQKQFEELVGKSIHRYANLINCENATGNTLTGVKNSEWCFNLREAQDVKYCLNGGLQMNNVYDGYGVGAVFENGYMAFDAGVQGMELIACGIVWGSSYAYYSFNCHSSYEIFGCTGLRNKKFCIFNKQYSEEEYFKLKAQLIEHMRQTGEWGEFFPPSISPFGINETLAYEYTPISEAEAKSIGFKWQEKIPGTFGRGTLKAGDLPETIAEVQDSITREFLTCEQCEKNYRIVPQELAFYRKHSLPLPTLCPEDRYKGRLNLRLPHLLWHGKCMCLGVASNGGIYSNQQPHSHAAAACANEFETPYAPDRPEIVYCEECYQAEV